jgi:thioredoxin-related protein
MKIQHIILLLFFIGSCIANAQTNSTPNVAGHAKRPNIYDESADGSKQIAEALETATKEHKHVLLMFGANDCGHCHLLHAFFETDKKIAEVLKSKYLVVMIDVQTNTPNTGKIENWHNGLLLIKYSPVYKGVPFVVILDANGKLLTTQDAGNWGEVPCEGDDYSHDKGMAFLKEWAPK